MTALAAHPAAKADPLEVFVARAEARARLVREGDLDLHEAVDVLQAAALQSGLVGALGQDAVQAVMATAFGAVRADADGDVVPARDPNGYQHEEVPERGTVAKSTIDAAEYLVRQGDRDLHEAVDVLQAAAVHEPPAIDASFPDPMPETSPGIRAAASTVEALMFSLCQHGAAALSERACQRRLAELSTAQIGSVIERLIVARPRFGKIDDELLFLLGEQLT